MASSLVRCIARQMRWGYTELRFDYFYTVMSDPAQTGTAAASRAAFDGVPQATHTDAASLSSNGTLTSALSPRAWTSLLFSAIVGFMLMGISYL